MQSMRQRYQLPVGAVVHPLADPQDVPVIGLDHGGIVRCKRCRTYINPFVRWSDGGRWARSAQCPGFALLAAPKPSPASAPAQACCQHILVSAATSLAHWLCGRMSSCQ